MLALPTPHMGSVNTPATPMTRATSQAFTICPHTPVLPTPRTGSVNTPVTSTICATSQAYQNISPYADTTNATYGVCQHAGYSYDTCDLSSISKYLPIRQYYQCHVWGLSTRRLLLRHVRPHKHITISPHTSVLPTPRMGFVNTPVTPTTRATSQAYHNISPYVGTNNATYGVCSHAGKSYDTWDLTIISQNGTYTV
ncbi:unnamed protein product [Prunus armeniaca]